MWHSGDERYEAARRTGMLWGPVVLLLIVGVAMGGCLSTFQVGSPSPYGANVPGSEYRRADDIPTPKAFGFQFGRPEYFSDP